MSDLMGIQIRYEAVYCRESLETVLRALEAAVAENWKETDEWCSSDITSYPVDVDTWLSEFDSERLAWDDLCQEWRPRAEGAPEWRTTEFFIAFSPLSCKTLSISTIRLLGGALVVKCLIYASVLYEVRGDREINRLERGWDQIREALGEKEPRRVGPVDSAPDFVHEDWWRKRADLEDTFSAWPRVKAHLRRVIDALLSASPAPGARIDPRLLGPMPTPVTDEALRGRHDLFRGG